MWPYYGCITIIIIAMVLCIGNGYNEPSDKRMRVELDTQFPLFQHKDSEAKTVENFKNKTEYFNCIVLFRRICSVIQTSELVM